MQCGEVDWGQAALSGTIAAATAGISYVAELGELGRFGRFGSLLGQIHGDFVGRLAIQTGVDFTLSSGYDVAFRGASFSHAFQRNLVSSITGNLIGEGIAVGVEAGWHTIADISIGEDSRIARALEKSGGCGLHSFSADTKVETPDGEVPIGEIEVGDTVLAYNADTGKTGEYTVTATMQHEDDAVVTLTINGEDIETTPWHLFYTDEGWVAAGELKEGDQVLSLDGDYGVVDKIFIEDRSQTMYDLTVEDVHTFAVGDGDWVVHNQNGKEICSLYAPYWGELLSEQSGLSRDNQDAIVLAIRTYDPDLVIAARPRAWGAAYLDGILENKPEHAEKLFKLASGVRFIEIPQLSDIDGSQIGSYFYMAGISDLDIGLVARWSGEGYTNVLDSEFIEMMYDPVKKIRLPDPNGTLPGNLINTYNGADIVMHGSLHNGFIGGQISLAEPRFPPMLTREPWFLFNASGLIDIQSGSNMLKQMLPNEWALINGIK